MPPYKNQHKISETYIRSWSHDGNSVKTQLKSSGKIIDHDPISSMFSENYKYSYSLDSFWSLPEAEEEIYSFLQNLKIIHHGNQINNAQELHRLWTSFDEWEIYDKCGNRQDNKDIKDKISSIKSYFIENQWNLIFENKWNQSIDVFLESVENFAKVRNQKNVDICYSLIKPILEFAVMLYYRSEINDTPIDIVFQYMSELFPDIMPFFDTEELRKSQYYKFTKKEEASIYLLVEMFYQHSSYCICKAPPGEAFHTSDNPCFKIKCNKIMNYCFPISPNYCLLISPDDIGSLSVEQISSEEFTRINNVINSNAKIKIVLPC